MRFLAALCLSLICFAMTPHARAAPASGQDTPDEPIGERLWSKLREQDRLLEEMLSRLTRIEALVTDLSRLIAQMPGAKAESRKAAPPPLPEEEKESEAPLLPWFITLLALLSTALLAWRQRQLARRLRPAQPAMQEKVAAATAAVSPAIARSESPTTTPDTGDQALELAEIMLSMGLGHGAAQTLVEQIQRQPKQGLRHWLKLLEIYRRNGQQAEFERSAEELRRYFNVRPEDWRAPTGSRGPSIEDFPHIVDRLVALWGKPQCRDYIEHLLLDNRGGTRTGFPQAVAEELLLLSGIARQAAST